MLTPTRGEATSDQVPLTSGRSGNGIFAHVEPPLTYGGPVPSTHLNHVGPPPKLVKMRILLLGCIALNVI